MTPTDNDKKEMKAGNEKLIDKKNLGNYYVYLLKKFSKNHSLFVGFLKEHEESSFEAGKAQAKQEALEAISPLTRYERSIYRLNADDVMGEGVVSMLRENEVLDSLNRL